MMTVGCATMFSGTTQHFAVRTEPSGAQVILNGNYVGATPLQMDIHRDKDLNIVFREPGYPEKALLLRRDFNPVAALNLLSPICWAIDLATGAMFRVEPDTLLVSMDPAAAPAPGQIFSGPVTIYPPVSYPSGGIPPGAGGGPGGGPGAVAPSAPASLPAPPASASPQSAAPSPAQVPPPRK
jgi:hypothetical protein